MAIMRRCRGICRSYNDVKNAKCSHCEGLLSKELFLVRRVAKKLRVRPLGICTRTYAQKKEAEWILEESPEVVRPPAVMMAEVFAHHAEKLAQEGKAYTTDCKRFFRQMLKAWGNIEARELTPIMISDFQSFLRGRGLAPATVDRYLAMGKAAYNSMRPDEPNPFKKVKLYRPKNILIRWLNEDEEHALLEVARANQDKRSFLNFYGILLVALNTGLRKDNILRLNRSEVNFSERTISVIQKNDLPHVVPINSVLHDYLRSLEPNEAGWYFPNPRTGKPYLKDARKTFQTCKRLAGIKEPFRFHDLRHSFAVKTLRQTRDIALVSKLLGHANITITAERYAHVLMEDRREAVERIASRTPNRTPEEIGRLKVVK